MFANSEHPTLLELPVQKPIARVFNPYQAIGELMLFANSEHSTLPDLGDAQIHIGVPKPKRDTRNRRLWELRG